MYQLHEHNRNLHPSNKTFHTRMICSEISPTTILAYHSTEHEIKYDVTNVQYDIILVAPWPIWYFESVCTIIEGLVTRN